ncbi:MAG TPA: FHA domain-containing protein [Polyangiaceae bacterium]|nr:FHA domain-containing protein [Polyangiaceae bacterium]
MTADQNKKTTRTFQCKDALWQKFEQMARELECSVDYLVNDAMKQYARQRGYGAAAGSPSIPPPMAAPPPSSAPAPSSTGLGAPPPVAPPPPAPAKVAPPPPAPGKHKVAPPPAPPPPAASGVGAPPPLPAPGSALPAPTRRAPGPPPPPMPSGGARSMPPPPPPGRPAPAAPPPPAAPGSTAGAKLTISYQGETFPVTKDRFIIGRGKQSSDLTIKDPNVSRQHAMIEFSNGQYYIVDMGSTNGVEYNGQRVQRKVISEGDSFRVCDHELKFTFS